MHAFPASDIATHEDLDIDPIAIIGMSCRFPGAQNIREFWSNLRNGVESVTTFDRETLRKAGVPEAMLDDPSYIPKACVIEGIDEFDAEFFGFSPQEADILDPQQRIFLECVWNALEEAGYAPGSFDSPTGVFAGTRLSTYLYGLSSTPYINAGSPRNFQELLGNDKDYLASRVSYKLNLKGPSMTVQTACSTSLVATHLACESLRSRETDMAVAGGSAILIPQRIGFLHHEGMILSPDGHCRPFDIGANGTTFGNGAGAVVLKRLSDALADRDTIWAVIRGNAVNNDGSRKAGYTAPGMEGQMAVIEEAQELAGIFPESVSYVEGHGTGTPLGDPIEVEALTRVFRKSTNKNQFCSLGSVKANIGHLDSAAGIASLIKTALALHHKEIPPVPNFTACNPAIHLAATPFRIETKARPWPWSDTPRRAGVSSFGIGGTNAHLVLEEAPAQQAENKHSPACDLFVLSARTDTALKESARNHAQALSILPDSRLADACFTSRQGRTHFAHRFALSCTSLPDLRAGLNAFAGKDQEPAPQVSPAPFHPVFLFTGQGAQYAGMGRGLHAAFPEFKDHFNRCAEILAPMLDISLHELLFSRKDKERIGQTIHTQPALFALEYSLARTWMDWGVTPAAMMGHSLGEYVAACLAGVFSLEDALGLVLARARLMDSLPRAGQTAGAMAAVFAEEETVQHLLEKHEALSIAALNAPESVVVSGPQQELESLLKKLEQQNLGHRRLAVSHAFHSRLMDPVLNDFEQAVAGVSMQPPSLRYISNLTGDFADPTRVTTSAYWRDHLRRTVRFASGVRTLENAGLTTFLEVGPHPVLSGLVRQCARQCTTISSLRRDSDEQAQILTALSKAYAQGADILWKNVGGLPQAGRIPLPTYPFQRKRHWAAKDMENTVSAQTDPVDAVCLDTIYAFSWKKSEVLPFDNSDVPARKWSVVGPQSGFSAKLGTKLNGRKGASKKPDGKVCLLFTADDRTKTLQAFPPPDAEALYAATERIRRLASEVAPGGQLVFVTANGCRQDATSVAATPMQVCLCSIVRSVRKEFPDRDIRQVDIPLETSEETPTTLGRLLQSEGLPAESMFREHALFVPQTSPLTPEAETRLSLRKDAAYLITGGTGGIGLGLAQWLAFNGAGHIALVSRSLPGSEVRGVMKSLAGIGSSVHHHVCDVGNEQDVQNLFAELKRNSPPVRGIFHLAGTTGDTPREKFIQALNAKAAGAHHLHTHAPALDVFVLFSSVTALYGFPGDTAYSAANAYLNALAAFRRQAGQPALSINWGAWDAGMTAHPGLRQMFDALGMHLLPLGEGLKTMGFLLSTKLDQAVVMDVDEQMHDITPHASPPASATPAEAGPEKAPEKPGTALVLRDPQKLRRYLATEIRDMLRLPENEPDHDADLISLGLDSLMFLTLAQTLSRTLGVRIGPNELFSNSTVAQLATRLIELAATPAPAPQATDVSASASAPEPKADSAPDKPFELTDIQYAYWIGRTDAMELGRVACHTYFELDIENLDLDGFERAWNRLIERHAMLRCFFLSEGKQQILQVVPPYVIAEDDLTALTDNDAEQHLLRTRKTMSHLVHNASRWPLFEIRASRIKGNRTRIHVSFDLLIADFHSITILMRELNLYYTEKNPALAPLGFTFKEYVQCEADARKDPAWQAARQYWANRLDTLPPSPPLPLAKRIADISVPRFTRNTATLPKEQWKRIKDLAAHNGLTPSCLLLAVYAEVLGTWSASRHFCINLTLFNRHDHHPQVNDIVGDFTSVTLLEVDRRQPAPFMDKARELQARFWKDMEHRDYSGVRVIRDLNARRSASGGGRKNGLGATMPVVFTANISGGATNQLDTLMGKLVHNESQTPQVWLDHQVFEQQGCLVIMWDHVTNLFPDGMVEAMFQSNLAALNDLSQKEEAWNACPLCMLPPSQVDCRARINSTAAPLAEDLLHTLFADQLAEHGSRMAISQGRKFLTYSELANRSAALANTLKNAGIGRGDIVAVSMRKGWEQIVAVLGILFSNAAFVPISPDLPEQRRHDLAAQANVRAVITQPGSPALTWPKECALLVIDAAPAAHTPLPVPEKRPGDLAYVIFTSGSTGKPKGVMISHQAAVNTIHDINTRFHLCEEDSVLALSDLSFDLSIYDIFGALAAGAAIILPDAERARDPEHWRDLMFRAGATIWNSAPPLMRMLVEYAEETGRMLSPTLRLALLSGDWIPTNLPRRIRALAENCKVVSLGGATEASIWSILHPVRPEDEHGTSIPYGRPMRNQDFHILDADMNPCPDWVPGSLFIGGHGLAMGYLNDTQKTAESFVFHPKTNARLYKTGDLGRYMTDGTIEFLGREDFQVKIRGHRIEPGEIEAALGTHPQVTCAAVLAQGENQKEKRLVAYVQTDLDAARAPHVLQEHLAELLPAYMLPAAYVRLDALPVTPNGKLDRKALPVPDLSSNATEAKHVAPSSATERKLATLWEEFLERTDIGVEDDFFSVGGDSLIAARLVLRIRKVFAQNLPLTSLFEHSTISRLARLLDSGTKTRDSDPAADMRGIATSELCRRAVLPRELSFGSSSTPWPGDKANIFLTGATGFLGAAILEALLEETDAHVFCMVRCKNERNGIQRLEDVFRERDIPTSLPGSRVTIVPGDLEKPFFGMERDQFVRLGAETQAIIHCGARVQYVYPYQRLETANVRGTIEALRLAGQGEHSPRFIHVSTSAVVSPAGADGTLVTDATPLEFPGEIPGGYAQTKWVAEHLVRQAGERGLDFMVFRPGTLWADSRTGFLNREDFPSRLVEACLAMGVAPDMHTEISILPVDTAARAIVALSTQPDADGRTWNLLNPTPVSFRSCIAALRDVADIHAIPYPQWREALARACTQNPDNRLAPLLPMMPPSLETMPAPSRWELTRLRDALKSAGISIPVPDAVFLTRCLQHLAPSFPETSNTSGE